MNLAHHQAFPFIFAREKLLVVRSAIVAHIKIEEETALSVLRQTFEPVEIELIADEFYSLEDVILQRETEGTYKMILSPQK
jgi:hypothetical protein